MVPASASVQYCHYVAGLVGIGLSRLFSASQLEDPEVGRDTELANSMGLFLQKTNIIRDYLEDTQEGRVFWPQEVRTCDCLSPQLFVLLSLHIMKSVCLYKLCLCNLCISKWCELKSNIYPYFYECRGGVKGAKKKDPGCFIYVGAMSISFVSLCRHGVNLQLVLRTLLSLKIWSRLCPVSTCWSLTLYVTSRMLSPTCPACATKASLTSVPFHRWRLICHVYLWFYYYILILNRQFMYHSFTFLVCC